LTEQNPNSTKYKQDLKQIKTEGQQAIAGWDTKESTKSSTKPTRSFDIHSKQAAVLALANFVILAPFSDGNKESSTMISKSVHDLHHN
jgi:hypothetical protein